VRGDVWCRLRMQLNLPQFTTHTCGPSAANFFLHSFNEVQNPTKDRKIKNKSGKIKNKK